MERSSANVTKPNPRERPISLSTTTCVKFTFISTEKNKINFKRISRIHNNKLIQVDLTTKQQTITKHEKEQTQP
jgi:hypothetical protein